MATLHLIRNSAFINNDLAQCLELATNTDILVLIDDACYNVHHPLIEKVLSQQLELKISIMNTHARARAISVPPLIEVITMNKLIELTFTYDKVITWQ